uniref:Secreted protein n=1 Tax=Arundo donax TaxID=35708 RepID=A0A0A9F7H9_ARUDO
MHLTSFAGFCFCLVILILWNRVICVFLCHDIVYSPSWQSKRVIWQCLVLNANGLKSILFQFCPSQQWSCGSIEMKH